MKLKSILLIDDDDFVNFMHKMIIEKKNCAEKIDIFDNAQKALDFLIPKKEQEYTFPELIFLDINMPGMSGWDFMDEYRKIEITHNPKPVIIILTSSIDPHDEEKAREYSEVSEYRVKPLSKEMLNNILETQLPNFLD